MELKKVPRNGRPCDSCDNSRDFKFLYSVGLKKDDDNPPLLCKKCMRELKGQLQRLRWS